ncbi:MAG TPA: His-Xaa-Ser system radical SAM maturase HxsB [Bryobacteraceae bacterium]|jgi:His-Xaa-Ser system radical SAM maturase HxsB
MARTFFPTEKYGTKPATFSLLPFRFMRLNSKELLVNEAGEFLFAPSGTVQDLAEGSVPINSELYLDLKAKHFLYDEASSPLFDLLATKIRTKFDHINGGTKLHIFVVTLRCEHSCDYCQVSRQLTTRGEFDMTPATADRAIEMMMDSPSPAVTLEFQGGEPLLAFDMIQYIVPRAKRLAKERGKLLDVVLCTNLACITDEILSYLRDERIKVSTSLDGPAFLHNRNRPRRGGDSYEKAIEGIQRCREVLGHEGVAALMTTTAASLEHVTEIIDEYVRQDFHSIFLRPISPYGFAIRTRHRTGYEMDKFVEFYKKGLDHILEINRGGYRLAEVYSQILLTKILTPHSTYYVDMQSPAGGAWNVLVYNYDGDVYASDESRMLAEMKDWTFRLGNVHRDSRASVFTGEPALKMFEASCNQALAGCSDCAFQSYCGADPVYHYATQGDMYGHRPTSGFCTRNMSVLKHLFSRIEENDRDVMRIFWSWITGSAPRTEAALCD